MPVYSERFYEGTLHVSDGVVAAYTVPAGHVAVVRCIDVYSGNSAAHLLQVGIDGNFRFSVAVPASLLPGQWRGRQVWRTGESLSIVASTANMYLMISGYLLTA